MNTYGCRGVNFDVDQASNFVYVVATVAISLTVTIVNN